MHEKTTHNKTQAMSLRFGRIHAAILERKAANGPFHTVTFSRSYQEDGEWHDTDSSGRDAPPSLGL